MNSSMPYRVVATDGMHLTVLLRLAEEYDVSPQAVDTISYQLPSLPFWFFCALEKSGAVIEPRYIW